jgi:multiple antibiotic resistance protein
MTSDFFFSALITLLVTIDPAGLAPIFMTVTAGMSPEDRKRVALRATATAFGILTFFAVLGEGLLHFLRIGLPAFRIAGGLLLFWIAFEMVFERRTDRKQHTAEVAITIDHVRNIAAFPLAIPLLAGPGAITAVILLSARTEGNVVATAGLLMLIGAVLLCCLAVFVLAGRISALLGTTGNVLLSRLLGVILAALAVQFVIDGISEIGP